MKIGTLSLSLAIGLLTAGAALAGGGACDPAGCEKQVCGSPNCCARCGRHGGCEKYCKLVETTREIKKTVWSVKCEEFCPLLPTLGGRCCCDCGGPCPSGKECCDTCCNKSCGTCDPCAVEREKRYNPPKCGHTRVKKTLEKKEVTCKVPAWKCVVEYCCPSCAPCQGEKAAPASGPAPTTAPAAPPAPPAPKVTALPDAPALAGSQSP
jgi:hypothetical protein